MYAFLFDRKSLFWVGSGSLLLGGLLFFAGLTLGVRLNLREEALRLAAQGSAVHLEGAQGLLPLPALPDSGDPATSDTSKPVDAHTPLLVPPMEGQDPVHGAGQEAIHVAAHGAIDSETVSFSTDLIENELASISRTLRQGPTRPPVPSPATSRGVRKPTLMVETAAASEEENTIFLAPSPRVAFSVQVGAFTEAYNAQSSYDVLERKGYEPVIERVRTTEGGVLHKVRIGRFESRVEADRMAARLADQEGMDALVRQLTTADQYASAGATSAESNVTEVGSTALSGSSL